MREFAAGAGTGAGTGAWATGAAAAAAAAATAATATGWADGATSSVSEPAQEQEILATLGG